MLVVQVVDKWVSAACVVECSVKKGELEMELGMKVVQQVLSMVRVSNGAALLAEAGGLSL